MMKTLAQIKARVRDLAKQINGKPELLPTFGSSDDFGRPHIEVRENAYHYIVLERGQKVSYLTTNELDELLYWIFRDITSQMGYSYELAHRNPKQDFRRIAFAHSQELLNKLDPVWKTRRGTELSETLEKYPYKDNMKI